MNPRFTDGKHQDARALNLTGVINTVLCLDIPIFAAFH